jgi:hypothetical protein
MAATAESTRTEETCFLYGAAVGLPIACQHEWCSFWEEGQSVCALERLGLRGRAEKQPELTRWLLKIRSELSAKKLEVPEEPLPPYTLLPLPGFRR